MTEIYKCHRCGKTYKRLAMLKLHLRSCLAKAEAPTDHPAEEGTCRRCGGIAIHKDSILCAEHSLAEMEDR